MGGLGLIQNARRLGPAGNFAAQEIVCDVVLCHEFMAGIDYVVAETELSICDEFHWADG